MNIKGPRVVCAAAGRAEPVQEVAMVQKPHLPIEPLGFTVAEAPSIRNTLPQQRLERQAMAGWPLARHDAPLDIAADPLVERDPGTATLF